MIKVVIPFEKISKMGAESPLGYVYQAMATAGPEKKNDKKILLVFPQTSSKWRERHHGPKEEKEEIVPEYVLGLFCKDILHLVKEGYKAEIDMPEVD